MSSLKSKFVALLLLTLPFAGGAFACDPKFNQVSSYARNDIPDGVLFVGQVQSVVKRENANVVTMDITFRTTRWFKGATQDSVIVRGMIGSGSGTNCSGVFDFSANNGEEWLIFGQTSKGKVNPDLSLSRRLWRGEIPPSVLKELQSLSSNSFEPKPFRGSA